MTAQYILKVRVCTIESVDAVEPIQSVGTVVVLRWMHTRTCMCDFTHPPEASQTGRAAAARRAVRAQAFIRLDDQRPRGAVVAEPAGLYLVLLDPTRSTRYLWSDFQTD